jgi:hypothetical protein
MPKTKRQDGGSWQPPYLLWVDNGMLCAVHGVPWHPFGCAAQADIILSSGKAVHDRDITAVTSLIYNDIWQQAIVAGRQFRSQSNDQYKLHHVIVAK